MKVHGFEKKWSHLLIITLWWYNHLRVRTLNWLPIRLINDTSGKYMSKEKFDKWQLICGPCDFDQLHIFSRILSFKPLREFIWHYNILLIGMWQTCHRFAKMCQYLWQCLVGFMFSCCLREFPCISYQHVLYLCISLYFLLLSPSAADYVAR